MGAVSPMGSDVAAFWAALCRGESGLRPITHFNAAPFRNNLAGEVKDFRPAPADASLARAHQYAARAIREACGAAPLDDLGPVGIVTATNFGAAEFGQRLCERIISGGGKPPDDDAPASDEAFASLGPQWQMNWLADYMAAELGLTGPRATLSLSCASGVAAIGLACEMIRSGRARAAVACGYDELSLYAYSGLSALRAITPDIIRPFDKNRKGTIFAEGAGAVLVESRKSAVQRGAPIMAILLGHAMNNDAFHMTAPDKTGHGIIAVMRSALADAAIEPDAIDHVNAHGTGTQFNDKTETAAIKEVFGERAYRVPVNSMKSMMGHTMGAAGVLETIGSVLTVRDGVIPPTINLVTPDPECDLDYVPGAARRMDVRTVLCNSYGFGGTNAALVLRRWEGAGAAPRGRPRAGTGACPYPKIRMNERSAAITGIGLITPIGTGCDQLRESIARSSSGICEIACFDASRLAVQLAGEVPDFDLGRHLASMKTYVDRASAFALASAMMALTDAAWLGGPNGFGSQLAGDASDGTGLCLGSAWGCQDSIKLYTAKLTSGDPKFAPPLVFTHGYANAPNSLVAIEFGLRGHNACFSGGWTAGAAALESALDLIRRGGAGNHQRLLAGATDALSEPAVRAALAAGILSMDLCRPFDAAADGLLLGEGAAMLALEPVYSARERSARIRGLLLGTGSAGGTDARAAIGRAITAALDDAGVPPDNVDAVFASASGLPQLDAAEANAIAALLPAKPPVVALKALLGDPMGAWMPIAIAAAIACMNAGIVPAAPLLRTPISADLHLPREPLQIPLRTCLVVNVSPSGYAAAAVVAKAEA